MNPNNKQKSEWGEDTPPNNTHQQPSQIWNDVFEYRDGEVYRKTCHFSNKTGARAGGLSKDGYIRFSYNGRLYNAHRIIWEMHNGPIPEGIFIDHKNGVRTDNRIENLRLCTNKTNLQNITKRKGGKYPYKGVKHDGYSWRAVVQRKDIGKFNNMVEAAKAYDEVAPKVFGEFALTNQMLIDRGVAPPFDDILALLTDDKNI